MSSAAAYAIRVAMPGDAAAVGDLLRAAYPVLMREAYAPAVLARSLPLMTVANVDLLAGGTFHIAKTADGAIVGCGGWSHERPGTGDRVPGLAHIRHFATHPDWARRGVGGGLLDACVDEARAAGTRRLECYASLNAEAFYAAMDFRTIEQVDVRMTEDVVFPSLLMAREI